MLYSMAHGQAVHGLQASFVSCSISASGHGAGALALAKSNDWRYQAHAQHLAGAGRSHGTSLLLAPCAGSQASTLGRGLQNSPAEPFQIRQVGLVCETGSNRKYATSLKC